MGKYQVTFIIEATYDVEVEASSKKEALEKAFKPYWEASLGDFEYMDLRDTYVGEI